MEKIYMEENNNKRRRKSVFDFSVGISFVIAIFSMLSLVVFGIVSNQGKNISYAAPVTGDTFTFYLGETTTGEQLTAVGYRSSSDHSAFFRVPLYYSAPNNTNPIFCIEHNKNTVISGTTYTKGNEVTDYGLLSILNRAYYDGSAGSTPIINDGGPSNKFVEAWIVQTAIWMYLYEKEKAANGSVPTSSVNYISDTDIALIKEVKRINVNVSALGEYDREFATSVYTTYIKPMVDAALAKTGSPMLSVSKASGNITKTSDGNYYQSTLITVSGVDIQKYSVALSGISGAFLVDENGATLSNTDIPIGKKFYVRIPKANVTTTVQTLNISVSAVSPTYTGYIYSAANNDLQKILSTTCENTNLAKSLSVDFVGSDDTGLNKTQTIYFIGLVVLLCGIGIVYANAKAAQAK